MFDESSNLTQEQWDYLLERGKQKMEIHKRVCDICGGEMKLNNAAYRNGDIKILLKNEKVNNISMYGIDICDICKDTEFILTPKEKAAPVNETALETPNELRTVPVNELGNEDEDIKIGLID